MLATLSRPPADSLRELLIQNLSLEKKYSIGVNGYFM